MKPVSKPSYSTTKTHLWMSSILAWVVILALTAGAITGSEQAVAFGMIAVPSMAGMIAGMLGVHRHYGSKDFEAAAEHPMPPASPYNPRADPGAVPPGELT
jgi:ABC-type xylose transport system permease subunit